MKNYLANLLGFWKKETKHKKDYSVSFEEYENAKLELEKLDKDLNTFGDSLIQTTSGYKMYEDMRHERLKQIATIGEFRYEHGLSGAHQSGDFPG